MEDNFDDGPTRQEVDPFVKSFDGLRTPFPENVQKIEHSPASGGGGDEKDFGELMREYGNDNLPQDARDKALEDGKQLVQEAVNANHLNDLKFLLFDRLKDHHWDELVRMRVENAETLERSAMSSRSTDRRYVGMVDKLMRLAVSKAQYVGIQAKAAQSTGGLSKEWIRKNGYEGLLGAVESDAKLFDVLMNGVIKDGTAFSLLPPDLIDYIPKRQPDTKVGSGGGHANGDKLLWEVSLNEFIQASMASRQDLRGTEQYIERLREGKKPPVPDISAVDWQYIDYIPKVEGDERLKAIQAWRVGIVFMNFWNIKQTAKGEDLLNTDVGFKILNNTMLDNFFEYKNTGEVAALYSRIIEGRGLKVSEDEEEYEWGDITRITSDEDYNDFRLEMERYLVRRFGLKAEDAKIAETLGWLFVQGNMMVESKKNLREEIEIYGNDVDPAFVPSSAFNSTIYEAMHPRDYFLGKARSDTEFEGNALDTWFSFHFGKQSGYRRLKPKVHEGPPLSSHILPRVPLLRRISNIRPLRRIPLIGEPSEDEIPLPDDLFYSPAYDHTVFSSNENTPGNRKETLMYHLVSQGDEIFRGKRDKLEAVWKQSDRVFVQEREWLTKHKKSLSEGQRERLSELEAMGKPENERNTPYSVWMGDKLGKAFFLKGIYEHPTPYELYSVKTAQAIRNATRKLNDFDNVLRKSLYYLIATVPKTEDVKEKEHQKKGLVQKHYRTFSPASFFLFPNPFKVFNRKWPGTFGEYWYWHDVKSINGMARYLNKENTANGAKDMESVRNMRLEKALKAA